METSFTAERILWANIKQRCFNTKGRDYAKYGGRGIMMHPEWRSSFETFIRDVGPRPTPSHQLDRINNNGPYAPGNVRWATIFQQANNKRSSHFLEFRGRRLTVAEWERCLNISPGTLKRRVLKGWSIERIFTQPIRKEAVYTFEGKTLHLREWAVALGIKYGTLSARLLHGWPVEKVLGTVTRQRERMV
jgi:hypothetical protein